MNKENCSEIFLPKAVTNGAGGGAGRAVGAGGAGGGRVGR